MSSNDSTIARQKAYIQQLKKANFKFGLTVGTAFVRGIRDIGYKNTGTALDELIDNAYQAGASNAHIVFGFESGKSDKKPSEIAVIDNGDGMIPEMIRASVLWGGTDRHNDRTGLGRYGYGLPSSCVSQGRRYEVYSIVKGEKSLIEHLHTALQQNDPAVALSKIIDPIIEVCDDQAKCSVTGLRLIDIWRYFRHTWSLEYRSIPGRQMAVLVRNAANPKRPVMGIALLASPVVRTKPRDEWIGWVPDIFIARLKERIWEPKRALRALQERINDSIKTIRYDDLITRKEINNPTDRVIMRLEQRSAGAAGVGYCRE